MEFAQKPVEQGGLGLTKEQAHGLVATMQGESGRNLNPGAYNPDDLGKPSGGTAQWRDDRLRNLQEFARRQDKDWKDRAVQQEFLRHEMLGKGDLGGGSERRAYEAIKRAETREQALAEGVRKFERPQFPDADIQKRSQFLYGHEDRSTPQKPDQPEVLPNGAPAVLKPASMPNAPGTTMPEWLKRSKEQAEAVNATLGGVPPVGSGRDMFKATPLGVGGDTDNSRTMTIKFGDQNFHTQGVSDPKEAAEANGRAARSANADLLRNMKSAFG